MIKFEIGKTYFCRSIGDNDCIFEARIIKRTEKSVWIKHPHTGEQVRKSIKITWDKTSESFMPLGSYSMAPCITAEKVK